MPESTTRSVSKEPGQPLSIVGKDDLDHPNYIQRLELILAGTHDAPWLISPKPDTDPDVADLQVWWSDRLCELLGYSRDEIANRPASWKYSLIHPDDEALQTERRRQLISGPSPIPYEVEGRFLARSGEYRWFNIRGVSIFENGRFVLSGGSFRDVHDAKNREVELARAATTDALTGLPNRSSLMLGLERAVAQLARRGTPYTLVYLDLNRFKPINDAYGHQAGDAVLRETAVRLLKTLRPDDLVARLHGDEFAVILRDVGNPELVEQIAQRISESISRTVWFDETPLHVTASIGLVLATPDNQFSVEKVLSAADSAMYEAKRTGRAWSAFGDRHMYISCPYSPESGSPIPALS